LRVLEFDALASELAPGFSPFQYRWAAFGLRKRSRLSPELLGKVVVADTVVNRRAEDIKIEDLPTRAGLYLFIEPGQVLYGGMVNSCG